MKMCIGLDVHLSSCTLAVKNEKGKLTRQMTFETTERDLISAVKSVPAPRYLCLEEGTMSQWVHDILCDDVDKLYVVVPEKRRGNKTDLQDAIELAEMVRVERFPRLVAKPGGRFRILRELVRVYDMQLSDQVPWLFEALKWVSAAYICWLAWKVANMRLSPGQDTGKTPGFMAGLVVHPLNPKAWAMIVTGFTTFVSPVTPVLQATATIAVILLTCQLILHPIWSFAGDRIAQTVAGTRAEAYLMWTLAALTVLSVLIVLFGGGTHT